MREMREQSIRTGKVANFRCGPYEVLRISYDAHMSMVKANEESNLILKGLRSECNV